MSWRKITPMSERLDLCRLAAESKYAIAKLARDFCVSRKTAYKWIGRYKEQGDASVFDRSRRPSHSPCSTDSAIVEAVLRIRDKYPVWGPRKLHRLLVQELAESAPSKTTVGRILERHGLTEKRLPNARQEAFTRFQRAAPNELWQIDFTSPFTLPTGEKMWPLPVLDDQSRYCLVVLAMPDTSSESAVCGVRSAAKEYGLPEEILSDHGSAFGTSRRSVSAFTAYLWALGVEHIQGRCAHPQTQGKLERFNQTLQKECISRNSYSTLQDWNKSFEEYRHIYNEVRPHESLGDNPPATCYNPSSKAFGEPDRLSYEEGEGLLHRKVDVSGRIWLLQHRVEVGGGLAGWVVSARHEGDGVWTILFRGRSICQATLSKLAPYKPRP